MEAVIICILQSNKCFRRVTKFLVGLMIYKVKLSPSKVVYQNNHIVAFVYGQRKLLALGQRFGLVVSAQRQGVGSRGSRSGQISRVLRSWEGLVIYITR